VQDGGAVCMARVAWLSWDVVTCSWWRRGRRAGASAATRCEACDALVKAARCLESIALHGLLLLGGVVTGPQCAAGVTGEVHGSLGSSLARREVVPRSLTAPQHPASTQSKRSTRPPPASSINMALENLLPLGLWDDDDDDACGRRGRLLTGRRAHRQVRRLANLGHHEWRKG